MKTDQHSLFQVEDEHAAVAALASTMSLVRAAMNRVAEEHPTLSRDLIADLMTEMSRSAGVKLTKGNTKNIKLATLEKWLSPTDRDHPPNILTLVAYCLATKSIEPIRPLLKVLGCEVMTPEDRRYRDYGKAIQAKRATMKEIKKLEAEL